MRSWYQATINLKGGNETVESIEASGKSVDEAVLQALARLGRRDEEVEDDEELEEELAEEPVPFLSATDVAADFGLADVSAAEGEMQEVEVPTREDVEITVDVLQHILRYMNIHATVQVRSTNPLSLNIHGIHENLGLLIGRRGETLSALQLLVSLIVGHRTKHRMRIVIDAENYRERREENLRSLALRGVRGSTRHQ